MGTSTFQLDAFAFFKHVQGLLISQYWSAGWQKGGSNTENSHCLLDRCYWLRCWWSCLQCSTHWLDTLNTESRAGTVNWSVSPSAASSLSPRWKEFLKEIKSIHINMWSSFWLLKHVDKLLLTFYMCKSTEWPSGTVSSLPHVIAFGRFVDLKKRQQQKKATQTQSLTLWLFW